MLSFQFATNTLNSASEFSPATSTFAACFTNSGNATVRVSSAISFLESLLIHKNTNKGLGVGGGECTVSKAVTKYHAKQEH